MAVTTITPTALSLDTATADLSATPGTLIVTGADGGSIDLGTATYAGRKMLLYLTDTGTAQDITVTAGDRPPSQRADAGALAVTMAASDVKALVIEIGRFLQNDQTILITSAGNSTSRVAAFILPREA